jgi:NAD+ synthase (glutamine-hydrolysing)
MKIALGQINSTVGALDHNASLIRKAILEAQRQEVDLLVLPELVLSGYPPEDLLLRPAFIEDVATHVEELAHSTRGSEMTVLLGAPWYDEDLYNACIVLSNGEILGTYYKHYLPNYGVFDEERYFARGDKPLMLSYGKINIGVTICEDIWQPGTVTTDLALAGAQLIVNLSASPFHLGKGHQREEMLATRARDNGCFIAYANLIGGQDELIFDGQSLVISPAGNILRRGKAFEEDFITIDIDPLLAMGGRLRDTRARALRREAPRHEVETIRLSTSPSACEDLSPSPLLPPLSRLEEMRQAIILGLRDYMAKNGFERIVLGMSGGIDSALTAALAVEALGKDKVMAVSMPSQYSSGGTRSDAQRQSEVLGIEFHEIPISETFGSFGSALSPLFEGLDTDVTEQNLQARIRGTLLMALSNKFGSLLLSTGNKSEVSCGYATLYGDMAGGYCLLKDVYKTDVFALSSHLNESAGQEVVLETIIDRPPSAELAPDQKDTDSLPPYPLLDAILNYYVEGDLSRAELIRMGYDADVVNRVANMTDRAEYKRRQAAPGVKLNAKAFGRDRRVPITNGWRG